HLSDAHAEMQKEFCVCRARHNPHLLSFHQRSLSNNRARKESVPSSDRRRTSLCAQASCSRLISPRFPPPDRCARRECEARQTARCPLRRAQSFSQARDKQSSTRFEISNSEFRTSNF